MKFKIIPTALLLATLICSCVRTSKGELIAEANGKKLYLSDIAGDFPENISKADSAGIISAYAATWVRRQLLIQKAIETLNDEQKDVDKEIEDYRASLLIYRMEQNFINKNIDTAISKEEIEKVYNENKDLFLVQVTLVKCKYVKIQTAAPETENIKKKYLSKKTEDITLIDNLCSMYAEKYDIFGNNWISIRDLNKMLPQDISEDMLEKSLMKDKGLECGDSKFTYFIIVYDVLPKGSVSPLEMEKNNIKNMILNERKRDAVKKMEDNVYNSGLQDNIAKIYTNKGK